MRPEEPCTPHARRDTTGIPVVAAAGQFPKFGCGLRGGLLNFPGPRGGQDFPRTGPSEPSLGDLIRAHEGGCKDGPIRGLPLKAAEEAKASRRKGIKAI